MNRDLFKALLFGILMLGFTPKAVLAEHKILLDQNLENLEYTSSSKELKQSNLLIEKTVDDYGTNSSIPLLVNNLILAQVLDVLIALPLQDEFTLQVHSMSYGSSSNLRPGQPPDETPRFLSLPLIEISSDGEAWQRIHNLAPDNAQTFSCTRAQEIRVSTVGNDTPLEYKMRCGSRYIVSWDLLEQRWVVWTLFEGWKDILGMSNPPLEF